MIINQSKKPTETKKVSSYNQELTSIVSVRIQNQFLEKIKALAKADSRTINSFLNKLIKDNI